MNERQQQQQRMPRFCFFGWKFNDWKFPPFFKFPSLFFFRRIIAIKELLLHFAIPPVLAAAVFLNGVDGDFVHDDVPAIVRNPDVTGNNGFAALFFNDFWGFSLRSGLSHKSYRPLTTILFRYWTNISIVTADSAKSNPA